MTTVYVNGKRVDEDDLSKIEIKNEEIKKIFAEKLMICKNEKKLTEKG